MNRLRDLGSHVALYQDGQRRKVATGAWARERFVSTVVALPARPAAAGRAGGASRRVTVALLAGLAAAAGVIPLVRWARHGQPLTFTVGEGGSSVRTAEMTNPGGGQTLRVLFSDGTRFDLDPATSARVLETSARGARVAVENGRARIAVPPGKAGLWSVEAGPYRVRITGTRLDVVWRPGDERLTVALHEGHVQVSGGNLPPSIVVSAGQTLIAEARGDRWRLDADTAPAAGPRAEPAQSETPPAPGAPAAQPTPVIDAPQPSTGTPPHADPARPARATAIRPPVPRWRQLAAAGDFQAAMQQADAEGFERLCQRASAKDLLTLSEAARFAGDGPRAKQALLALRRRFGDRPEAAVAGFVLGRLAFDDQHDYRAAARWFASYLESDRSGPLSREAAGRLIEALAKAGDRAAAREAARAYLERFPGGPHARFAGHVLEAAP